jgi:hypothetical protein
MRMMERETGGWDFFIVVQSGEGTIGRIEAHQTGRGSAPKRVFTTQISS